MPSWRLPVYIVFVKVIRKNENMIEYDCTIKNISYLNLKEKEGRERKRDFIKFFNA